MTRSITFPKTGAGEWTNRETGIRIERYGKGYRPFRPAWDDEEHRIVWIGIAVEQRTLADARFYAKKYAHDSYRYTIAEAWDEAHAEDASRSAVPSCEGLGKQCNSDGHGRTCRRGLAIRGVLEIEADAEAIEDAHAEALIFDAYVDHFRGGRLSSYGVGVSYDMVQALHPSVVESAHVEALREDAERYAGCTAPGGWSDPHLFESEPVELNPEGYDEFERCGQPADAPVHVEGAHAAALAEDARRMTYVGFRATAANGFHNCVQAIRRNRADGHTDPTTYANYRSAMRTYAQTIRFCDRLINTV